ncbi:MAG: hypothetical protein Q7V53_07570 [Caldisericota bacterium]|nr:hypothetical protein [Caldisericota bacterium]
MAHAFQLLWAGFLFMFDVRLQGFDILPDVIGYVLMFRGLTLLAPSNRYFKQAASLAPLVAAFSLLDVWQPIPQGGGLLTVGGLSLRTPLGLALTLAGMALFVLNLILVSRICLGIAEMAEGQGQKDLAEAATSRWGEYKSMHILLIIIWPLAAAFPAIGWVGPVALLAVGIAVYFSMMGLMRQAQSYLEDPGKAAG